MPQLRIIEAARVPEKPLDSRIAPKTVLAGVSGLLGLSLLVFLIEYMKPARRPL
jgi:uncharacterized protein involved in exopolysaccharide biosynthesis